MFFLRKLRALLSVSYLAPRDSGTKMLYASKLQCSSFLMLRSGVFEVDNNHD